MLMEKIFKLKHYNTNIKTEFISGLTTFITASWILFVNPVILGQAGMDMSAIFLATILMMVIGALLMGFYANLPIIIAPSLGGNTWFAFTIVLTLSYTWQQGLAAVFFAGVLFFLFSLTGLRAILINAFSESLRFAISIGIGVFIMGLGFKMSGLIIASGSDTILKMGNLFSLPVISTLLGLIFIIFLESKKIKSSLLLSILILGVIGLIANESNFTGIISLPSLNNSTFFSLDFSKSLSVSFWCVVFSLLLLDILDSTGSFMSVLGVMKTPIYEHRVKKAMLNDGLTTAASSLFGCSPATVYIESATGIASGGKTGLTAIFFGIVCLSMVFFSPVAQLGIIVNTGEKKTILKHTNQKVQSICTFWFVCLSMVFFSPVLTMIPNWATSPALIYVGYLMFKNITEIKWNDITEAFPAFVTIMIMPLTSSITNGIGIGVFLWIVMALLTKKFNIKKHWILLLVLLGYLLMIQSIS